MSGEPGELVAIPFPYADLQTRKKRPVIVLTAPDRFGDFIALAVTSAHGHENTVAITTENLVQGELPKPSWVRLDKVFTLSESSVIRRYGKLSPERYRAIQEGLCRYMGCME